MKISGLRRFLLGCAIACGAVSCVTANYNLGGDFIPLREKYLTRTVTIPLEEVWMLPVDSLSGYSSYRMTIGSINDDTFGMTRRNTAITLIPFGDSLDFGHNFRFGKFHFIAEKDTISCTRGFEHIMQKIRVYELKHPLDSTFMYSCQLKNSDFAGSPMVCAGVPMYDGGDSLSFDFTEEFAMKYVRTDGVPVKLDSIELYTKEHPGIFICTDDPMGYGGRLDFFSTAMDYDSDNVLYGNYAELMFTADYYDRNGKLRQNVDTAFFFGLGATSFNYQEASFYAFNCSEHESSGMGGLADDEIRVEGGSGLKPVIKAAHLRELVRKNLADTLRKYGQDIDKAMKDMSLTINRATIYLPYDMPEDYRDMEFYPQILNPTMRVSKKDTVIYAGLTDASVSTENQGDIDRSNLTFRPDVSHHLQQILATNPNTKGGRDSLERENLWFLILAEETFVTKNDESQAASDYYTQMAYLNYYNSMLGGYGGYSGGYNSYGYDNYYNYYMMQAMYASMNTSSTTTSTSTMLDKDRYYNAVLRGPSADPASGGVPRLKLTYSFRRSE